MQQRIAHLIYPVLFDSMGRKLTIGGIQSYLLSLSEVLSGMNIRPVLYQRADRDFVTVIGALEVRGIGIRASTQRRVVRALWRSASQNLDQSKDIVVFGSQELSLKTNYRKTITIQHGVSWDIPLRLQVRKIGAESYVLGKLRKYYQNYNALSSYRNSAHQVHVDHNYSNWLKTQIPDSGAAHTWIIPNCAFEQVSENTIINRRSHGPTSDTPLNVLFARRFAAYRGVHPMLEAAEIVRRQGIPMKFTFAGEGPLEGVIRKAAESNSSIQVTNYAADSAVSFHLNFDVAAIPSVASEGTSLAVAEALTAGCAVVASGVGGISNMILDSFNGIIVMPEGRQIADALVRLHNDRSILCALQQNALHTGRLAFSRSQWAARWHTVFSYVSTLQSA